MMLSKQTICKKIMGEEISITPFNEDNLGPASYDLTLGNTFVELQPDITSIDIPIPENEIPPQFRGLPKSALPTQRQVRIRNMDDPYPTRTLEVEEGKGIVLPPKMFILATTEENLEVSGKYAVYIEGRSSVGRLGLQVQNAGFVDPGFNGQITLELFNASDVPIALTPGRRVCQAVFFELDEETEEPYHGKYQFQEYATPSRIEQDIEAKPTKGGIHLL